MKVGDLCILCESNINHDYSQSAVVSLDGKQINVLGKMRTVFVQNIADHWCAFVHIPEIEIAFFIDTHDIKDGIVQRILDISTDDTDISRIFLEVLK